MERVTAGLLLLDKPVGPTSHDLVQRTRRLAGTRRVGHAGTLDPAASGLMILGVDGATRLLTYLVGLDKTYTATIRLGFATTTDDAEGTPLGERGARHRRGARRGSRRRSPRSPGRSTRCRPR